MLSQHGQGDGDQNGDGDVSDVILHVYDISSDVLTNLGADPTGGFQRFQVDGKLLSFAIHEFAQGATDLNGDGDFTDLVLHFFDANDGSTTNLALDVTLGHQIQRDLIAFVVTENRQGQTDLNADGDALDVVLHVADLQSSPQEQIDELIELLQSIDLSAGVEQSGTVLLNLVQGALDDGNPCAALALLQAFRASVRHGGRVSDEEAETLTGIADDIIETLQEEHPECP